MTTKPVSIQYRYLNKEGLWDGFHLKDMLADILQRSNPTLSGNKFFEDVSLRKIDLDQDGSYVVLNKLSDVSTWAGPVVCGQLIHVKAGTQLPGILGSLDQHVPELELQNMSIGERTQLVEGVLYFAVANNHVGLIEGQRTRSRTLERYLTSLFQQAGEIDPGQPIILNAKLEGRVQQVKELSIAPQKVQTPSRDLPTVESSEAGEATSEGTTVLDVLKLLGWSDTDIDQLQAQVPEDGWIEGLFKLAFKKKRGRSATVERQALETALRNLNSEAIGLLGEGAREKGGNIKLSQRKNLPLHGDLLDPEHAMNGIVDMLKFWSETGRIDYDFET